MLEIIIRLDLQGCPEDSMGHSGTQDVHVSGVSLILSATAPTSASLVPGGLVLTPPGSPWLTLRPSAGHYFRSCPLHRCPQRAQPCPSLEKDGIDISKTV